MSNLIMLILVCVLALWNLTWAGHYIDMYIEDGDPNNLIWLGLNLWIGIELVQIIPKAVERWKRKDN